MLSLSKTSQPGSRPKPPVQKKFWDWIEASLVGFMALVGVDVLVGLLFSLAQQLLGERALNSDSLYLNFALFGLSRGAGLYLVWRFIKRRGISLRRFGFKRFRPLQATGLIVSAMTALFVSSALVIYVTQRLFPALNLAQEQEIVFTAARGLPELVLAFAALVVIAPLVEEVIFRGLLLPALSRRFGIVAASIVSSFLFAAVHWQLNVGIITFIMGLLLSWLYYRTRSLWPAIMFHSLKNLLAFILIFNLPR